MGRNRRTKKKQKRILNNVTAESIIKSNIDSLKSCYNAAPSRKPRKKGIIAPSSNTGNDLALIAAVFGQRPADSKSSQKEEGKTNMTEGRTMLFADPLQLPRRGGLTKLQSDRTDNGGSRTASEVSFRRVAMLIMF